ncbi:ergic3 [Symbiodinium natans]|uniref:Ergic3 protein n=1 Tax=Symbiodinium natans TaxID=878477 RepID=A0A812MTB8_9DINO|nr:ergic3 [Symbiodinium natans]
MSTWRQDDEDIHDLQAKSLQPTQTGGKCCQSSSQLLAVPAARKNFAVRRDRFGCLPGPKRLRTEVVRVSRKGDEPLGLEFDKMDPENLMVAKLTLPGLIATHNQKADSEKVVCPGDRIKKVNGKEALAEELIAMLDSEPKLTIVLQHCQELEHYIEKRGKPLGLELAVSEKATCLTVQRIEVNGLVAARNEASGDRQIRVHDKIVAVDGVHAPAPELMRKIKVGFYIHLLLPVHGRQGSDYKLARKLQQEEERNARRAAQGAQGAQGGQAPRPTSSRAGWQSAGSGRSLGGTGEGEAAQLSPEERRQRALEAAERRQNQIAGVSEKKVQEMRNKEQKDALLGKLAEHYARQKIEMPMGLHAASVEQLRQHWETVRKDRGREDAVLQSPAV